MTTIGKMYHNGEYRVMYDDIADRDYPYRVVYRYGNHRRTLGKYAFKFQAFQVLADASRDSDFMPRV